MRHLFDKEQFDRDCIETTKGFIVYNAYPDNSIYIHILYVKPEYRQSGHGKFLENALIKKENPNIIYTYVDLTSKNPELSLLAILNAGYKIDSTQSDKIILRKVINVGN